MPPPPIRHCISPYQTKSFLINLLKCNLKKSKSPSYSSKILLIYPICINSHLRMYLATQAYATVNELVEGWASVPLYPEEGQRLKSQFGHCRKNYRALDCAVDISNVVMIQSKMLAFGKMTQHGTALWLRSSVVSRQISIFALRRRFYYGWISPFNSCVGDLETVSAWQDCLLSVNFFSTHVM